MGNRTVFDTNIWISYMITAKYDELESMLTDNVCFLRSTPTANDGSARLVFCRQRFQLYS
jgi:predicted nucleic acid-binding protein